MSAIALARLGVMPETFGKMSLGYYTLLCRELDSLDVRHHYPGAAIQAVLVNINRDPEKSEPVDAWDFMPGWEKTPELTEAEIDAQGERFFAALDNVIAATKAK